MAPLKRVIFNFMKLLLSCFFVTPLPADSDVSYRDGGSAANVLLPVLLLYLL